jgi:hypothetical protein
MPAIADWREFGKARREPRDEPRARQAATFR